MSTTSVNTVIVGAGQAGLAVSYYLSNLSRDHVVLEQADQPGDAWRHHRWDSFTLNTPRWQSRVPGVRYGEDDPDDFMPKQEVVAHLEGLAQHLPVRTGARVTSIARSKHGDYVVAIEGGEMIKARNVVMATGLYQTPKIPRLSRDFPAQIKQLHSDSYRNPEQLLPGAVLVVGSAQSGAQIAEELYESGRKVYLATGRAGRTPRRYRGKDANWWFARMGQYDRKASELPSPKAKFSGKPHISGTKGGHTINLHQFARDGVTLLGRLAGVEGGIVRLNGDLHDNLAAADRAEAEFVKAVDAYVVANGMAVPEETLPVLRDGFEQEVLTELDLREAGITNMIWATGYSFDFSIVKLPVTDDDGFPIQTRGVAAFSGLFFVGLPWLHTAKSGLIYGLSEDAHYIADRVAERPATAEDGLTTTIAPQGVSKEPRRSRAAKTWADRVMSLVSLSALSLMLDGFATHVIGSHPTAPYDPPQNAVPRSRLGTRYHNNDDGPLREVNMNRTFKVLALGAIIGLSLTAAHAAEVPLPPHVSFVTTPASQLHLGMTADDVIRVMGQTASETNVTIGATRIRKLNFTDAIPGQVTLSDGKVTRVTLDAFRMEKDGLISSIRQAWPGFASSVVRRALGEPAAVFHHTFFGIEVDQWIYSRAGDGDASVFFRDDRVIAKTVGRDVPAALFEVTLPSPPQAESEGPMREPRLSMTAHDVREFTGALRFRVDYIRNGQPASREVYQSRSNATFVAFTFVDDVMTEFENLGRMPDDASFQGR